MIEYSVLFYVHSRTSDNIPRIFWSLRVAAKKFGKSIQLYPRCFHIILKKAFEFEESATISTVRILKRSLLLKAAFLLLCVTMISPIPGRAIFSSIFH
jgi:hypothetical protein